MNKGLAILILIVATRLCVQAQQVDRIEYFFDKDPGTGKGMTLPVSAAKDTVTANTSIPVNNLGSGLHTIHIRAGNTGSRYSQYRSQLFYVNNTLENVPPVVRGEYFLDQDPGIGMGWPMTKFNFSAPANTASQVFNLSIPAGIDTGRHYVHVRVQDATGHWSQFTDSFSAFTMPVTGLFLSAEKNNKNILLNWYTLTESNTSHFEVEKSTNSISFAPIGTAKAKGNSNTRSTYSFTDKEAAAGINFYRIREVDNDGKCTYSSIVKVMTDKGSGSIFVYPNPAGSTISAIYESNGTTATINIFDALGRCSKMYRLPASNNLQLDISGLASGTYTIHISDGLKVETGTFIKK